MFCSLDHQPPPAHTQMWPHVGYAVQRGLLLGFSFHSFLFHAHKYTATLTELILVRTFSDVVPLANNRNNHITYNERKILDIIMKILEKTLFHIHKCSKHENKCFHIVMYLESTIALDGSHMLCCGNFMLFFYHIPCFGVTIVKLKADSESITTLLIS